MFKRGFGIALFYVSLLVVWLAIYYARFFPPYVFPSPGMVADNLKSLAVDGVLWPSIRATLTRMGLGFGLAALLGIAFGLCMGIFPPVNRALRSLCLGLQMLPSVAWVPLALLIFGLRDQSIYFVIVMSSLPAVAIAAADGIARVPPLYLWVARTLGTPRRAMWRRVILPAALPGIITGLKLGWTLGWHGAVSAELIKSSIGLGFLLHMGRELNDIAQVIGIMLLTVLIGLLIDRLIFTPVDRRIHRAWGLEG